MEKLLEIIGSVNEESSTEELRRAIADARDESEKVRDDIAEYQRYIDELTASNADKDGEIARLKEENGRLFRDRIAEKTEEIIDAVDEKTDDEIADELRANIEI